MRIQALATAAVLALTAAACSAEKEAPAPAPAEAAAPALTGRAAVYAAVPRVYHERHTVVGCGRRSTRNKNCRSYPDRERRHKHQRKHGAAAAEFHNLKHCVTSDII